MAYACRITAENMGAIASEKPDFDLIEALRWLEDHGSGYFLRDESSAFDCHYFEDTVFHELYMFERGGESELFRRVLRL